MLRAFGNTGHQFLALFYSPNLEKIIGGYSHYFGELNRGTLLPATYKTSSINTNNQWYIFVLLLRWLIMQQSPTFWAPGTSFMKDNFSTDWRAAREDDFGMIQAYCIQAHLLLSLTGSDQYWAMAYRLGTLGTECGWLTVFAVKSYAQMEEAGGSGGR